MPRSIRMYGKKRGHRRTGSPTLGSLGEALFFCFFLLIGAVGLALLTAWVMLPEWRVNFAYVPHRATVLDTRVSQRVNHDGVTTYRPDVLIRYTVDGQDYEAWAYDITRAYSTDRAGRQAIVENFRVGQEYPCWVHPDDPETVVLVRGFTWWIWCLVLLPVAFLAIGGGGLGYTIVHWGKSQEHLAAIQQLTPRLDLFNEPNSARAEFPAIPLAANISDSPGTRLRFRLPIDSRQGWRVFAAAAVCLAWNLIVALFAVMAVRGHLSGEPNWYLTFFLVPFVALGVALIYYVVRQMLLVTGLGPTNVEISDHPLVPGGSYELFITQGGQLKFRSFEVLLVCDETAVYRQGTDTRTDRRRVFQQPLLRREGFEVSPWSAFEDQCQVALPDGAMHSFRSDHNEVAWRLIVRGDVAGWPNYERSFSLVVHPCTSVTSLA